MTTRLYLPVRSQLSPQCSDDELDKLLVADLVVFHPASGWVGFCHDDGLQVQQLLQRPERWDEGWEGAVNSPPAIPGFAGVQLD